MATAHTFRQARSLTGIGISLAVHALLIGAWQLSRTVQPPDDGAAQRVQFLRLLPAPAPAPDRPASAPAPAPATRPRAAPARTQPAEPPPAPAETIALPAPQTAEAPAAPSARDMLRDAKAAVGAIDRALRKENPGRGIHAPVETAQMKLERGIEHAAEMAPNKWYEAPKTQEILDPGGYGRKRYRVITAKGTYCLTYESNHGPDGRDTMRDGIPPKMTNCPPHEEPAKAQKWE